MAETTLFWVVAMLAAALVGMGKGGLPVVGMLGVPVLSLVLPPVEAAGLLLPVYVLSDMVGIYAYRHEFSRRNLAILVPAGVFGVAVGWATASIVPERAVLALVGLIGGIFALRLLIPRKVAPEARPAALAPGLFWGTVMGFTSFVSHAGAPPFQVYVLPQRLPKAVFAGTTTIAFAAINAVKLLPYWAMGQLSAHNLHVAALLTLPAVVAVFAGLKLVRILPERLFFLLVTWTLLAVSLKLIADAVSG